MSAKVRGCIRGLKLSGWSVSMARGQQMACGWTWLRVIGFVFCFFGCDDEIKPSPTQGEGPIVFFDLDPDLASLPLRGELPFPFPNDLVFEEGDPSTGKLLVEIGGAGALSSLLEAHSAWGGAPSLPLISIPLSHPIDLDDFTARHENNTQLDDALFLICVSNPCAGEITPIEVGVRPLNGGVFAELNAIALGEGSETPPRLMRLNTPLPPSLTASDERAGPLAELSSLNGKVSLVTTAGEESELQTPAPSLGGNAVILTVRPKTPLTTGARYAVLLTRALRSNQGPVQGPEGSRYPLGEEASWNELTRLLDKEGLQGIEVSFTWWFTVGKVQKIHEQLRVALEGGGQSVLARRTSSLQPRLQVSHAWLSEDSIRTCVARGGLTCDVDPAQLALRSEGVRALAMAWGDQQEQTEEIQRALYESYRAVKGLFSGELSGWTVTQWGATLDDPRWQVRDARWRFWCILPERGQWIDHTLTTRVQSSPFPVLIWAGHSGRSRLDLLLWAGHFARAGYASCAMDLEGEEPTLHALDDFALSLSVRWREQPWDLSVALENLGYRGQESSVSPDMVRPINRALGLQQLAHWLAVGDQLSSRSELGTLRSLLSLSQPSAEGEATPDGSVIKTRLVYGGEAEGASSATLAAAMDPLCEGLINVDMVADLLQHRVSGAGSLGGERFLTSSLGGQLIWRAEDEGHPAGFHWLSATGSRYPLRTQESAAPLDRWLPMGIDPEEFTSGHWFALYNTRSREMGERIPFDDLSKVPLSVSTREGDRLELLVLGSEVAEEPIFSSLDALIAPMTGVSVPPASEAARVAWRLSYWADVLDDPLENYASLASQPHLNGDEVRTLIIAHPRSRDVSIAGSLRFAEMMGIGAEVSSDPSLYHLTPYEFLQHTQAYDPRRSWGGHWFDWDDLDELTQSLPSFTRNTQLRLSRPTWLGGYHALRLPWRSDDRSGLSLPRQSRYGQLDQTTDLSTRTMNFITSFLAGLDHSASATDLDASCLSWLQPDIAACAFLRTMEGERSP